MSDTEIISGHALLGEALEERSVSIIITRGIISAIEDEKKVPDTWILPAFFNAHTHLADTVAMDLPFTGSLTEIFTPPNGLKHRILKTTPDTTLVRAMRKSIQEMQKSAAVGFADFREGGVRGVSLLKEALTHLSCHSLILGRDGGEQISDGAGISSTRDCKNYQEIVSYIKESGKILAFHAGEQDPFDVDDAVAADPDLLIHGTFLTRDQISSIADAKIPVAVCARSNAYLGVADERHPPIQSLLDEGITLMLGTDNVMIVQPDLFSEIAYIHTRYHIEARDLLQAAVNGSRLLSDNFFIDTGKPANLTMHDVGGTNLIYSRDMCSTVVKRGGKETIRRIIINGVNKQF